MPCAIDPSEITGVVLAGGRGARMGGADKGLLPLRGVALAAHALVRLRPQVGFVVVSANRHLDAYAALGAPVCVDRARGDHSGPLAGFLAALDASTTPFLATVPCDSPRFPEDLVERLAAGLVAESADVAVAATRDAAGLRRQPVFCLLRATLRDAIARRLEVGERGVAAFAASARSTTVVFADAAAFANANTRAELEALDATP